MIFTPSKALLGLNLQELTQIADEAGQPSYRGRQLFEAVYRQRVQSTEQITTLPQDFRTSLLPIGFPQIKKKFVSLDGTIRYLIEFADGQSVETVWMPDGDGGETGDGSDAGSEFSRPERPWDRATICVSSQVGCAVDCQFCLTALLGVKRNLTAGEIVGQIAAVLNEQQVSPPSDRTNIVFMGMGEPFLNYENFIKACQLLAEGVGIPESRMTVSTAGIVPRIVDLGAEPLRPKLAISLNASNDELRSRLMPINRKWNLEKLIAAARTFPLRNRERLTFEYVLLDQVNDSPTNARDLVELIRGIRAKVNLIALNPGPGIAFQTPTQERVLQFQKILTDAGIPAYIRKPRGRDIYAACGQLKHTLEVEAASGLNL
jgi:23S rRNA (adenine2503-C2)-methyltransferase